MNLLAARRLSFLGVENRFPPSEWWNLYHLDPRRDEWRREPTRGGAISAPIYSLAELNLRTPTSITLFGRRFNRTRQSEPGFERIYYLLERKLPGDPPDIFREYPKLEATRYRTELDSFAWLLVHLFEDGILALADLLPIPPLPPPPV